MCRQLTPLNAIAFAVLIISSLACALSFVAPFWVVFPHAFKEHKTANPPPSLEEPMRSSIGIAWKGLLAYCFADGRCVWYWANNFEEQKTLPAWYLASQIAFACGILALIVALLLQSIYSCCMCCERPCRLPTTVASFAIATAGLVGLSLGLFGGFAYNAGWFDPVASGGYVAKLEWAFYVGIGGFGGTCLAAILFFCDGCCLSKSYRGYSTPSGGE